ncbi:MAG: hypothetical protein AB7T31_01710 [Gemmatimonadales bacterium]
MVRRQPDRRGHSRALPRWIQPVSLWMIAWGAAGAPVLAQEAPEEIPSNFEALELARSRACVGVLARVDTLDTRLAPLAERSQRLIAISQAIALEEREVIDSLRASDPLEAEVRAWFLADGELAQSYVASPSPALLEQRSAARDAVQQHIRHELEGLQAQADSIIAGTGNLGAESAGCSGAVFIRPAVLEACASTASPVCDAARDSAATPLRYRFVESAEVLWGLQELRAWSTPAPIQVLQDGQLGGARTVGLTRAANIAVTVAFGPQIRRRVDLTASETTRLTAIADSLGFGAGHPDLLFVPSLALQATLPEALGGETRYILHFGPPEAPDIVWAGPAGTGAPIEGTVVLGPARLSRLLSNEQLTLTALRPTANGENEPVFAIELTSLNQGTATTALAQYLAQRLASDLSQLLPPGAPAATTPAPPDSAATPR